MEPEGSLPHSEALATCPYPDPARSSPYPHIPLPEDPFDTNFDSVLFRKTAVAQWLRCCATNRKVAGSIPARVIGIFR